MEYCSFPEENGEERRTRVLFESPVCVQMASQVYIGPCVHASHQGHYFVSMAVENSTVHIYVYSIHFLEESGWVGEVLWEKSLLNVLSGSLLCARTFCSPTSENNWQP
jgi:hypothetical protein